MRKVIILVSLMAFILTGCAANEDTVTKHGVITEPAENTLDSAIDVLEEKPIPGKEVTMLTGTYFEATFVQGNGLLTDYVDDDKYVVYVKNNDGSECIQYQLPNEMYSYALIIDTDGGTSQSGIAKYTGDTNFNYTKTTLAEMFEGNLRTVFDNMVYRKVVGHDYVYTYESDEEEDTSDITKQKVSVYVDRDSYRVSKVISPYICYNFRYSDNPIDQMYTVDDILAMGTPDTVDSIDEIVQMTTMFTSSIIKYDEEYIQQITDLFEELESITSTAGGAE